MMTLRVVTQSVVLAAGTLLLASACSTFTGQKLGVVDGKEIAPTGIPYNLVRAQYTFSRTPPAAGQKKPTYAISTTYVPDPTQRYSLKIAPGMFTNPEFVMKLAATGALSATTATFTEQVTPTITSVGTFAEKVIGALATVALLDQDSTRSAFIGSLTGSACLVISDVPRLPTDGAPPAVTVAMKERIDRFKDDDDFTARFHYVTELEHACLQAALTEAKKSQGDIDDWENARKAYLDTHPEDESFGNRLTDAVKSNDKDKFKVLAAEIKADTDSSRRAARNDLFKKAGPAATAGVTIDRLKFFANMDDASWRARNLLYLESEIERATLLQLRQPDFARDPRLTAFVESARVARAATIDAVDLYNRSIVLTKFLESVRDKTDHGGKAPATAEFATARAELDNVLTQIEARRSRVVADAAPAAPPPITPLQDEPLVRVTEKEITDSKAVGWLLGAGATAPTYVLVLKEVK